MAPKQGLEDEDSQEGVREGDCTYCTDFCAKTGNLVDQCTWHLGKSKCTCKYGGEQGVNVTACVPWCEGFCAKRGEHLTLGNCTVDVEGHKHCHCALKQGSGGLGDCSYCDKFCDDNCFDVDACDWIEGKSNCECKHKIVDPEEPEMDVIQYNTEECVPWCTNSCDKKGGFPFGNCEHHSNGRMKCQCGFKIPVL